MIRVYRAGHPLVVAVAAGVSLVQHV